MRNNNKSSKRANDEEINAILKEFSTNGTSSNSVNDEYSEMASRYDVGNRNRRNYDNYNLNAPYENMYQGGYLNAPKKENNPSIILNDGHKVLYDAEIESKKNAENSQYTTSGIRVIYDADMNDNAAFEAPFDDVSNIDDEVEARIKETEKLNKKRSKKKKLSKHKAMNQKVVAEKKIKPEDAELSTTQRALKVFLPWKGDPKSEIVRKIIMDVAFILLFVCTLYMTNYFIDLRDSVNVAKEAAEKIDNTVYDDEAAQWAKLREKYPNVDFPEGLMLKFAELYAQNQDFAGWISISNTSIDTPVVQKADDPTNDYYLHRNFYKQDTKWGCPFMDYRNNLKELSQNTVIYGHNMRDNQLFAQLEKYMTVDGYKDSPLIIYSTPYKTYYWKVYTAIITSGTKWQDNGYLFNYIVTDFLSDPCYDGFIEALDKRALYHTGVGLKNTDKILTLSTCSYEYDGARLVVFARLLRDGESKDVDFSKIVINENPRYPQKYYDTKGLQNPYWDDDNWDPTAY